MGQIIELSAADGMKISAYRTDPVGKPRGGLVVIQEIWGVNDHIRKVTDGYAAEGYLVVAPALFDRVERSIMMDQYTPDTMQRGRDIMQKINLDDALKDVAAAVAAVSSAGKVGVVGYCFGGRVAWIAASRLSGIAASVPYYGGGIPGMSAEQPKCPVMLHFGEKDAHIPIDSVEAFKRVHPTLPVHIYAADHGFNCDQRGSYDAAAAVLARARTIEFLQLHVG